MALYYEGFGDDVADSQARVEGAHWVLEHELKVLAEEAEAAFGESGDVGAFDKNPAGGGGSRAKMMQVDLPQPDSPTMPKRSPSRTSRLTPRRARTGGAARSSEVRGRG